MRNSFRIAVTAFSVVTFACGLFSNIVAAQEKSKIEKALSYKPVQRGVGYEIPSREDIANCKLERTLDKFKKPGFVVYDATGRILRLFFDQNRDNNLDYWSFYKDGIEVYRDVDSDFDGRADEFRWLGSAGTRHGKDVDKNGTIDRWLRISASELAEEVFQSIRTSDEKRFKKLVVNSKELKSLNLGETATKSIATSVRAANSKFDSFVSSQKVISSKTQWTQFGSTRPSLVPKGQIGVGKDLIIFDHAAGVFDNRGKFGQISLGTIVEIEPGNWRVLELPEIVGEGQVVKNGGLFYPTPDEAGGGSAIAGTGSGDNSGLVKLFERYESLEKKLKTANGAAAIAKLEKDRADLFIELANASPEVEEKKNWVRQLADTVTSAYQTDAFPAGLSFLEKQLPVVKKMGLKDEVAYIEWRMIYSRFFVGHQNGDRKLRAKANVRYNADLEEFTKDYPRSPFAADALFQLGLTAEVTDRDDIDKAVMWYKKCQKAFPNTSFGKKSAGAVTRLTSEGKPLRFSGKTTNGKAFSLQRMKGKIVILHYWEADCEACIDGFEELQRLGAKYKSDIQIIGANLDADIANTKRFLSRNRSVNWPQLYSPGGPEKSSLATQLGIATLPMTLLIDQGGNLVEGNIPVDDLDREIQRLIRRASGSQANLRKSTR